MGNRLTVVHGEFDTRIRKMIAEGRPQDAVLNLMIVISRESPFGGIEENLLLDRLNQYMKIPWTKEDLVISLELLHKEKKISERPHECYLRQN